MRDKTCEEIVEQVTAEVKEMVKGLLERLMLEERELLLETHPTKGNGDYTRGPLTFQGPVEALRVPRVREGGFRPAILPERRRASLELSEAILCMYASGLSTRDIAKFLETVYGTLYSPQSISRPTQAVEEVGAWQDRPLSSEYYAIYLDGTFISVHQS